MRELQVDTPYGAPSDSLFLGEVAGRRIAFLPRHGRAHHLPPHRINYRANLWALRSVGVRQVLGPCAVGGLRPEYGPGTLLVPDQFVDRTKNRVQSYYDGLPVEDPQAPGGSGSPRSSTSRSPTPTAPSDARPHCGRPRAAAGTRSTAAPSSSSKARASRPARNPSGTRHRAGPWWA